MEVTTVAERPALCVKGVYLFPLGVLAYQELPKFLSVKLITEVMAHPCSKRFTSLAYHPFQSVQ